MFKPYFKLRPPGAQRAIWATNDIPWWVVHLCLSYGWPRNLPGGGVIGIVELGGGWMQADVNQFFKYGNAHNPLPIPTIVDVSVDPGAGNNPGNDADIEVALDIQLAGAAYAMATGKAAIIRMYWANNDALGIARAVAKAASDGCDVCSISWGADEATWGSAALDQMNNTASVAVLSIGMPTFAASGDNNSADGGAGAANVDAPASCPYVVGCGGTNRPHMSMPSNPETVWKGTGGGYSMHFPRPSWQTTAPLGQGRPMRMVPDIAANADPTTGYHIIYQGQDIVVGGTSAVAPLYAGLFAGFGRKLGFVSPKLWQNPAAFNDIISGDNGAFSARSGPDACTGLGTPKAVMLASLFSSVVG